jgi:oxygen-dependent protoporphyrinogen oxidase
MLLSKKIVVIGGGISGLSLAYYLTKAFNAENSRAQVTLLEARERFGGVIETVRGEGCLLEGGPDSFISEKTAALELCRELGLESEVIGTNAEHQCSYVFCRGRLFRIPEGFYLVAPVRPKTLFELPFISWPGKLRMACEPLIPRKADPADESIGSFIRRRFGQETLEKIGQPMMSAMYGGDVEALSLEAAFPRFRTMEANYGSVVSALRAGLKLKSSSAEKSASGPRYSLFLTLGGGLDTLTGALEREISPAVRMMSGAKAAVVKADGVSWEIGMEDGRRLNADFVCLALPASAARGLFETHLNVLASRLGEIGYESVVTVNRVYDQKDIPRGVRGFGFVVPATEKLNTIGCTFSTYKFRSRTREGLFALRLFLGGSQNPRLCGLADEEIERIAVEETKRTTGISATPLRNFIHRYPQAMPQYHVGHLERVSAIETEVSKHRGLFLTGNGYRGLGIPDCIRQAKETAEKVIGELKTLKR